MISSQNLKKGLRIPTVKSHSVGSIEYDYKVVVCNGGGLGEYNQIKYIKCNLCGFQKEHEMKEHGKIDHKKVFEQLVITTE